MSKLKFILSGGGTGGHIYPAIAIANELKKRFPEAEFLFVGAKDKMEMQKVPQAGYAIKGLWIAGLQRKLTLQNALFPIKLLSSLWESRKILKSFKPDVVIGTGGFASGPLLNVANSLNIPTLIQEQNSYPGITNKLLSKKAAKICVAYELNGEIINYVPSSLDDVKPVYEEIDGWESVVGIRDYDSLPVNAKKYIEKIEEVTSVRVGIVSTSPERDDTIIRG